MNSSYSNHLAHEKSPYLLQHADNPVHWYPWGKEAFDAAVAEDKPILLSVGYSTCHWCHVMAEESFSDPAVAEIMNRSFVSIKLDREERPDIDRIYISAVSALNGSAGWPLNVFLTPDGRPFYGGTYFPNRSRSGMPAWRDVLIQIERAWQDPDMKQKILTSAEGITDALERHLAGAADENSPDRQPDAAVLISAALDAVTPRYDPVYGGFSRAPKFPMPPLLELLLTAARLGRTGKIDPDKGEQALDMLGQTLLAMTRGGIFDQLGGGFHRYATDEKWHLPHFEKMLYDNAQLAAILLDTQPFIESDWPSRAAEETLDYLLREMAHPEGGFYSAQDADSYVVDEGVGEKREGAFYAWQLKEVEELLPAGTAAAIQHFYGLRAGGNVETDPLAEFNRLNIFFQAATPAETAAALDRSEEEVRQMLYQGRQVLRETRSQRPRPHRDDKILTAWNGLVLSALARGFLVLGRADFLATARDTVRFIRENLYEESRGRLFRSWRQGRSDIAGQAEDYILLAAGLLDLYQADLDPDHLAWALDLARQFSDQFCDAAGGACFAVAAGHDPYLIFRPRDDQDNVTPSATSAAALVFLRLAALTGDAALEETAHTLMRQSASLLASQPLAAPLMLTAMGYDLAGKIRVAISGRSDDSGTARLLETARTASFWPAEILLADDSPAWEKLAGREPALAEISSTGATAAALVCAGHTCLSPVGDPEELRRQLHTISAPVDGRG
ncbi:MAG: thioredoxin domain-containing protein [Desulfosudaceae bacterium]